MSLFSRLFKRSKFDSASYWEDRYAQGGNSGEGSYQHFADYKAEVINQLIDEFNLNSAVEFGCGDGNQLNMFRFEKYYGLDVSTTIISRLSKRFEDRPDLSFQVYKTGTSKEIPRCDATLSIDVIYHLTEPHVYDAYMNDLFASAESMVIIYAWNEVYVEGSHPNHVHPRLFTKDIEERYPEWELSRKLDNPNHPRAQNKLATTPAEFYIYTRR
ncbi:MAG: class I SAM-dependent methyltransferase [Flavobacteriales bacterium]|nr:class I SAM-dependent methyltransferase [Flavobacteriales bacterium]